MKTRGDYMRKIILLFLMVGLFLISGCAENTINKEITNNSDDILDNTIKKSEIDEKPDWLGEPHYTPDFFYALEPTDVLFEILVNREPDDLASESPVQLFRKDEKGNWIALDEMFDDGYLGGHGDKTKGDRTYSRMIEFYEEKPLKEMPLKIVVTTSDSQQYAVEFNLTVGSEEQFEQMLYETEEASNRVEQKLIEIMQSPPPDLDGVAQMLCDYLNEQNDIISSCEISHYSVWVTCNTGVLMEFSLMNLDEGEPPGG